MESPFVREAILYEPVNGKIRCLTCQRRCVIPTGGRGWCRTRENRNGRLVMLIYGAASSIAANPIEKKPFFHFHPGTFALTVGSWSCNFGCPWCQNWHISKQPPPEVGNFLSPQRMLEITQAYHCQGTSISFNEPTLSLEWSLEVFRLARQKGLYNTYVTNGYMTPEALALLTEAGLDAMNVDIKGDAAVVKEHCQGIDVEGIWETCRQALKSGLHLEITTLVIPTVNDAPQVLRGIAERIVRELSPQTPWHVSGYYPAYRFTAPATPLQTLECAWEIGRQAGLEYVYVGNLPGHRYENTYCPACRALLIRRVGFDVLDNCLSGGRCPKCGGVIVGVWG
mgnify:CR=1 FL=1